MPEGGGIMKIKHIDNSFYRLTPHQARKLSIESRLPKPGHEIRANPAMMAQVTLLTRAHHEGADWVERKDLDASKAEGWIKPTRISWHDGAPVKDGWTWALHVYWR
jgi:hypothetical protein